MNAQPPPPPPPPPPQPGGTPPPPPPPLRPPPPYIPSSQLSPSAVWFWVAGAIGVICTGISVALFISLFSGLVDDLTGPLTELQAPGEVTVQLEAGADRTIYRQVRESGAPVAPGAPDPSCSVTSDSAPDRGRRHVRVDPEAKQRPLRGDPGLQRGRQRRLSGCVRDARRAREPVPLAIGGSIAFWDLLRKGGLALALFFGGLIIAGAIVVITAVMRDNNKKKLQREALQRAGTAT